MTHAELLASIPVDRPLNAKQMRFVEEYLKDFNGEQAARRSGYSKKNARIIASENLSKPNIRKAVQDRMDAITAKSQDKVMKILKELEDIAFLKDKKALQHKNKSLELLGKYYSMWQDRIDITTQGQQVAPVQIIFEEVGSNKESK